MANPEIIINPNIDVKNKDVSSESCSETFLVITWYKPKKKPAPKGRRDLISKISKHLFNSLLLIQLMKCNHGHLCVSQLWIHWFHNFDKSKIYY